MHATQAETVSVLLETVGRIYRELGITFEFINIGGGLGIPYRPNQAPVDVATLVPMLRGVVAAGIKAQALPFEPKLYMENGRYVFVFMCFCSAGCALTLVCGMLGWWESAAQVLAVVRPLTFATVGILMYCGLCVQIPDWPLWLVGFSL